MPLGLHARLPVRRARCCTALEQQLRTKVSIGGGRERAAGVRLRATDADVTLGDGPEVTGPLVSLLLAVSGRSAARDLAGPGLRCSAAGSGIRRAGRPGRPHRPQVPD